MSFKDSLVHSKIKFLRSAELLTRLMAFGLRSVKDSMVLEQVYFRWMSIFLIVPLLLPSFIGFGTSFEEATRNSEYYAIVHVDQLQQFTVEISQENLFTTNHFDARVLTQLFDREESEEELTDRYKWHNYGSDKTPKRELKFSISSASERTKEVLIVALPRYLRYCSLKLPF